MIAVSCIINFMEVNVMKTYVYLLLLPVIALCSELTIAVPKADRSKEYGLDSFTAKSNGKGGISAIELIRRGLSLGSILISIPSGATVCL